MGSSPAPFSDIGKKAKDLLTKDYNFDHKFTLLLPNSDGMVIPFCRLNEATKKFVALEWALRLENTATIVLGLTATGLKRDQIFIGDISTLYKSGKTTVDVKVDTYSNVSTKVTVTDILPTTKATLSFRVPDHKSGKLDVQYFHPHAAIDSSIGLHPSPLLEFSAAIGSKNFSLGGDVGFDTTSASFTKYNAGISLNKSDFSAALMLTDKGQALKASYIHSLDPLNETMVAAEMTHKFSTSENSFTIGSSHVLDPVTLMKTRFSNKGKAAMLFQREWRPKSLVTLSAEYDSKAIDSSPKIGLAIALKP